MADLGAINRGHSESPVPADEPYSTPSGASACRHPHSLLIHTNLSLSTTILYRFTESLKYQ